MPLIVGADLALNHGAIVDINGNLVHEYHDGLGMMSSADMLYARAMQCSAVTPEGCTVVVDWDRNMATWGSHPTTGVLITMLLSFYGALCRTRDCDVHYVTPDLIRYCLGLAPQTIKSDVHEAVKKLAPPLLKRDSHGDNIDAWLLAYTFVCTKDQFSL
jgi:hypothetical protein